MTEQVLCITKDRKWPVGATLDARLAGEFINHYTDNFLETVFLDRETAGDPPGKPGQFLQVIPYIIPLEHGTLKPMRYRRTTGGNDSRLHNKWSLGIGGHIEAEDWANGMTFSQTVNRGIFREIREEFAFDAFLLRSDPVGLVYDPSNSVGAVHIGLVYFCLVAGVYIVDNDKHERAEFINLLEENPADYETWSELLIEELKK